MKKIILSITFLFSFTLLKEIIDTPPSEGLYPTREEIAEFMKGIYQYLGEEVNIDEKEWPFKQCYKWVNFPEHWYCSDKECLCSSVVESSNHEYIFTGFQEAYDPHFWEDPFSWFSYSKRTKRILLELKSDREKLLILPVRKEDVFEIYKEGDEVKIYECGSYNWNLGKHFYSASRYEMYNTNISYKKFVKTLYNCKGDRWCERENYFIYSGSSLENE